MKKIKFILAFHNHQPVGNFDFVLHQAFNHAYQPFLDVLENFPDIKMTLHYTGILWEWLEANYPQFLERLKRLHERGQVELMGGGFYEPILPSIPSADRLGQLKLTNQFLLEKFACQPRGIWVAERVWEPSLPKTIAEAGMEYVVVDDSHFRSVGLTERELLGSFQTEEEGYPLRVFPISEKLRYLIPFQQPEKTREYLSSIADELAPTLIVMADDGEKLGNWPGTHKWVYQEKWLERFFTMLKDNADWIETTTFSEYLAQHPPLDRVYLPTASYMEMMEWALPTHKLLEYEKVKEDVKAQNKWEQYRCFMGGGFWRHFLVKYPESNDMHKKMYYLSRRIHNSEKLGETSRRLALLELWQGQCNCAYWHGAFGGLYLKHLRQAIYRHLIEAEVLLDTEEMGTGPWHTVGELDVNQDGHNEVILTNPWQNLYLAPAVGGMIYEWDFRPKRFNLLDTLARREEAYHQKLREMRDNPPKVDAEVASIHDLINAKEEGLENILFYDWYRRASLLDHFLGWGSDFTNFRQCRYKEEGDFVNQPYQSSVTREQAKTRVSLTRVGRLWRAEGALPLRVQKTLLWDSEAAFSVQYKLTNLAPEEISFWWGSEFNLGFVGGDPAEKFIQAGKEKAAYQEVKEFKETAKHLKVLDLNEGWQLVFQLSKPALLWTFPIETVSNSEAGVERIYQSTVLFPSYKIKLAGNETWSLNLDIALTIK